MREVARALKIWLTPAVAGCKMRELMLRCTINLETPLSQENTDGQ